MYKNKKKLVSYYFFLNTNLITSILPLSRKAQSLHICPFISIFTGLVMSSKYNKGRKLDLLIMDR